MSSPFSTDKEAIIRNLKVARMDVYYKDFLKRSFRIAILMGLMANVLVFFVLMSVAEETGNFLILGLLIPSLPLGMFIFYSFFLRMPEAKIIRSRKNIEAEIISAIRFLILDLKAEASLFGAIENLAKNFDEIGLYLKDIINEVKLGNSLETTLSEAVEEVPSEPFRILLWQMVNHIQTGTDITESLNKIVTEIVEEQKINFRKYGKKLNVVSLLYMIVAIILPTIGFTIFSAFMLFIGVQFTVPIILGFWLAFSILQVIFLAISSGNRPVVES